MRKRLRYITALAVSGGLMAMVVPSAIAAGPYEPNNTITTATRVMGGTDYTAALETANDVDFFQFFVTERRLVDISISATGNRYGVDFLIGRDGVGVVDGLFDGTTVHRVLTLDPGRYVIKFLAVYDTPDTYQFRIDPANALVTKACYDATVAERQAANEVAAARRQVRHARGRRAKARANRVLAKRLATLRRDRATEATLCR
jgi:hypothetical protein